MANEGKFNARKISLSGILLALTVITLFLAAVLPVNELSLYALSSFFVSIIIIEFGIGAGWIFYMSSCLLSLIVIPNKLALIPYVAFFGAYGVIKYYIEKIDKVVIEYILKISYFNIFALTALYFVKKLFLNDFNNFPWWAVIAGMEVAFVAYDYVFTLFIQYYNNKLKKVLKV